MDKKILEIDQKLDRILEMLESLCERTKKLEDQTEDIHHYVPFVNYLEETAKSLSYRRLLPSFMISTPKIENKND